MIHHRHRLHQRVFQRVTVYAEGAWLVLDGYVLGYVFFTGVHIRFCGRGGYWFRLYGGLLGRAPSNQGLLPLTFGPSLRLRVPSLRSCSVGPPRSAIHGRTRLTRHPCRVAHCAEPPLGLSRGQEDQKPKRGGLTADLTTTERRSPVGASLLAKNARTTRASRQPALSLTSIASKLAPTEKQKKKRRTPMLFTTQQAER